MHNGCILCGGVGVGKSHTAVAYYLANEAPKAVLVITTAKKRDKGDWQDLWAEIGMHKDPKLTMGAVVIVDSWENIKKYEELKDAFVIFDEQRLVGTGAWVKAFYKIAAANRWIMLSATPGDNWLDYVPVFRANGFIKNITQFKEDHVVQRWTGRYYQVIGYRQVPKLVRWRNSLLVDMPYDKHTTRHTHEVAVEYDKELVEKLVKKRWHVYEDRPLTDASELFRVMRKVVYSDSSRLRAIQELLKSHPKLIVFYNFDFELEVLRTLSDTSLAEGLLSKSESQDPWDYLLSPEGLTENRVNTSGRNSSQDTTSSQSSVHDAEKQGHWTQNHGQGEIWVEGECPTAETLRTSDGSTSKTHESSSKKLSESSSRHGSGTTLNTSVEENGWSPTDATAADGFQIAEWNGHKHQEIPKTDSWVYLVQYVAGAEAWECVETDAIAFWSMPYSYKLWWQSHGRIDRLHTSFLDLHYYVLFGGSILEKNVKKSLRAKRSFNEASLANNLWK